MQLSVTGFSKLPKHGFSRPESTKKLSVPSSKQRDGSRISKLWEALEVPVVTLCCDTFNSKQRTNFFKATIQLLQKMTPINFSRIQVAHEIWASLVSVSCLAADLGHGCGAQARVLGIVFFLPPPKKCIISQPTRRVS